MIDFDCYFVYNNIINLLYYILIFKFYKILLKIHEAKITTHVKAHPQLQNPKSVLTMPKHAKPQATIHLNHNHPNIPQLKRIFQITKIVL
jgi:hypothetical protein